MMVAPPAVSVLGSKVTNTALRWITMGGCLYCSNLSYHIDTQSVFLLL